MVLNPSPTHPRTSVRCTRIRRIDLYMSLADKYFRNDHKSCSCSTSCGSVLDNLGWLPASTDDSLPRRVAADFTLGFILRFSPDIDLTATTDDTNSHRREEIVCSVAVHVNSAIEHSSGILANTRADHSLATGMILDEIGHIMNDASNGDEATTVLALVNIVVPFHDRELLERNTPVKSGTLLIKLLLMLLEAALLNFIASELLEVICETELLVNPDEPLGRIILMPFDGVAVVGGKLVVEIVIAFAESNQGSDDMITR